MESVLSGKTLDAVQMRRQHLKHGSAATNIPKFSISMEDSGANGKVLDLHLRLILNYKPSNNLSVVPFILPVH